MVLFDTRKHHSTFEQTNRIIRTQMVRMTRLLVVTPAYLFFHASTINLIYHLV